jgi:hypothetical protein
VIIIMNKKLLSIAVAAGLASSSAHAVVDLTVTPATGAVVYASELTIGAGLNLTSATAHDTTVTAGFTVTPADTRYIRFDLTGATLTDATGLTITSGIAVTDVVETLSSGGTAGDSFLIYSMAVAATKSLLPAHDIVLTLPNLTITSPASMSITYSMFADATAAVANDAATALATTSGTLASNAAATSVVNLATGAVAPGVIDVTDSAKTFVGGVATTTLGTISLADSATAGLAADGATDVTHAVATNAGTLVVTGDFTAAQDLTDGAPDGTYTLANVFIDHATPFDCASSDNAAATLTGSEATFAAVMGTADSYALCMTTNGVSTINEGAYTAVYTPTAVAGYTVAASTTLTTATLAKNGSTATLNLALSPTGSYPSFIRVSNTAAVAGDVTITLINDDGLSSGAFALASVAGQTTSSLGARASTGLLSMADLFAAAQVALPTFAIGTNSNKFRVIVDGEFGTIAAQSVTTSVDGNSFTTF